MKHPHKIAAVVERITRPLPRGVGKQISIAWHERRIVALERRQRERGLAAEEQTKLGVYRERVRTWKGGP